jgi:hypothetical protein
VLHQDLAANGSNYKATSFNINTSTFAVSSVKSATATVGAINTFGEICVQLTQHRGQNILNGIVSSASSVEAAFCQYNVSTGAMTIFTKTTLNGVAGLSTTPNSANLFLTDYAKIVAMGRDTGNVNGRATVIYPLGTGNFITGAPNTTTTVTSTGAIILASQQVCYAKGRCLLPYYIGSVAYVLYTETEASDVL